MKIGIIGYPNVGKTTIFNALSRGHAPSENYPFCTIEPNRGVVEVPDDRLSSLSAVIRPRTTIPARVEFCDVAGLVEGAHRGEGLGNQFLGQIRECHAIVQVVRCFEGADVVSREETISPKRELEVISLELLCSDLAVVEGARGRKVKDPLRRELLDRLYEMLSAGASLREAVFDEREQELVKEYGFLTLKPLLVVANTGEGETGRSREWVREAMAAAREMGAGCISLCGKIEEELSRLSEEESREFREAMGIPENALSRVIRHACDMLGLITFFTVEGDIVQAWAIPRGTTASRAAGGIHSDMEAGFIRTDVIGVDALIEAGSFAEARSKGVLRSEGREYKIADGEVLRVHFGR